MHKFDVRVVVPPYFDSPSPDRVTAKAGDDVTLTCDVTGSPKPNITWYKVSRMGVSWVDVGVTVQTIFFNVRF